MDNGQLLYAQWTIICTIEVCNAIKCIKLIKLLNVHSTFKFIFDRHYEGILGLLVELSPHQLIANNNCQELSFHNLRTIMELKYTATCNHCAHQCNSEDCLSFTKYKLDRHKSNQNQKLKNICRPTLCLLRSPLMDRTSGRHCCLARLTSGLGRE